MPTYDYVCAKCGHHFEQFQTMSAAPLKTCPKCKKKGLKRLIGGGAGLIFKGSGFYITDYKKSSSKDGGETKPSAGESKPAGEAKPASADGKKTVETKPASGTPKAAPS